MHAFDVLGDPVRRRILELLARRELAAGEVVDTIGREFGISQAGVSQHLRVLRDADLVTVCRHGTRRYYWANRAALGPLGVYLEMMWAGQVDRLASLAETADADATRPPGGSTA